MSTQEKHSTTRMKTKINIFFRTDFYILNFSNQLSIFLILSKLQISQSTSFEYTNDNKSFSSLHQRHTTNKFDQPPFLSCTSYSWLAMVHKQQWIPRDTFKNEHRNEFCKNTMHDYIVIVGKMAIQYLRKLRFFFTIEATSWNRNNCSS